MGWWVVVGVSVGKKERQKNAGRQHCNGGSGGRRRMPTEEEEAAGNQTVMVVDRVEFTTGSW